MNYICNPTKLNFSVFITVRPPVPSTDAGDDLYYATCPALPGIHEDGKTAKEAIQNAKESIVAYLLSVIKHSDPIEIGSRTEIPIGHLQVNELISISLQDEKS